MQPKRIILIGSIVLMAGLFILLVLFSIFRTNFDDVGAADSNLGDQYLFFPGALIEKQPGYEYEPIAGDNLAEKTFIASQNGDEKFRIDILNTMLYEEESLDISDYTNDFLVKLQENFEVEDLEISNNEYVGGIYNVVTYNYDGDYFLVADAIQSTTVFRFLAQTDDEAELGVIRSDIEATIDDGFRSIR